MPKKHGRIGRHGLPIKTERIIFAVTREQKASIKATAARLGLTTTDYFLTLHRAEETARSNDADGRKGGERR